MRSVQYISLAGLFAAATVSAGVVTVPFEKRNLNPDYAPSLLRRDGSVSLDAINNLTGGGYYAQFSIGTPPQKLSFLLDTGSSDTWVNSVTTDLCTDEETQETVGEYCFRQFNPRRSSSYKSSTEVFDITYLDGRRIRGNYFKDTVTINKASITGQQLGLAQQSVRGTGILGLGFRDNEASDAKYPTVVENLVSQKVIPVPAFSLYLNDLQTSQGVLLFGGVDTDKFHGGLATLPLQSLPPSVSQNQDIVMYSVNLDGFSASDVDTADVSAKAVLDSGSTITLLPDAVVQPIFEEYGVLSIQGLPVPFVDCGKANTKGATFNFEFKGKTIKVPIDEMVLNNLAAASDQLLSDPTLSKFFDGWSGVCTFGMSSTTTYGIQSDEFVLLGDTFLRSAYVVYDLQNKQIGIAQATLNSTTSSIVEFKAGSKTIPGPASTGDDSDDDSSDSSSDDSDSAGAAIYPTFSVALAGTLFMTVSMLMSAL